MRTDERRDNGPAKPLRLLVLAESGCDAEPIVREVGSGGFDVTWKRVSNEADLRATLDAEPWAVIVSDYETPQIGGLAALRVLQEKGLDIPFIIVSGTCSVEAVVEALKAGAHDFLAKGNLTRLAPAVQRELVEAVTRRERRDLRETLSRTGELWQAAFDAAAVPIALLDLRGVTLRCNRAMRAFSGRPLDEVIGQSCEHLLPGAEPPSVHALPLRVLQSGEFEIAAIRVGERSFKLIADPVATEGGAPNGVVLVMHDTTEMVRMATEIEERRVFLETLMDTVPTPVFCKDRDGRYVSCNRAFAEFVGHRRDEILGKTIFDFFPGEMARRRTREDGLLSDLQGVRVFEEQLTRHDGQVRAVIVHVAPFAAAGGQTEGVVGIITDVTALKEAEVAAAAARDRAQQYLDLAGVLLVAIDPEGVVTMINRRGCEILGYPEHELIGRNWLDLCIPDDVRPEVRGVFQAILGGETAAYERYENVVLTKSGERRLIVWRNTPLKNPDGSVAGHLSSGQDVTDVRRTEAQLRQTQGLEAIAILARGVAHEINNPVMGILNYAQLIADQLPEGDPSATFAAEIMRESERITKIVNALSAYARRDRQEVHPARMCDIVEDSVSLVRAVLRQDQVALCIEVPEDLAAVRCRSQQIQQVLVNLLSNARDALNGKYPGQDGNKKITVTARAIEKRGRPWIRTTVEDRGVGVPVDVRERMFEPFFTTGPRDERVGLGLFTSLGIVREHQGELVVESEAGQWSRFHVDLPVDDGGNP